MSLFIQDGMYAIDFVSPRPLGVDISTCGRSVKIVVRGTNKAILFVGNSGHIREVVFGVRGRSKYIDSSSCDFLVRPATVERDHWERNQSVVDYGDDAGPTQSTTECGKPPVKPQGIWQ